jgi:pentatricopeptide repeat protein
VLAVIAGEVELGLRFFFEQELGLRYLSAMSKCYGLEPANEHYGCVVDLLGRAGRINEAEELIGRMAPNERDGLVWTSLLRACVARGAEETGKRDAERAMEAEPWGAGAHVAMGNGESVRRQGTMA